MIATQTKTQAPKGRRLLVDRSNGLKAFVMPGENDVLYSKHDDREEVVAGEIDGDGMRYTLCVEDSGVVRLTVYRKDCGFDRDMGITFRSRSSEFIAKSKEPLRYSISARKLKEAGVEGVKL